MLINRLKNLPNHLLNVLVSSLRRLSGRPGPQVQLLQMRGQLEVELEGVVEQDDILHRFVEEQILDRSEVLLEYQEFSDEEGDVVFGPAVGGVELELVKDRLFNEPFLGFKNDEFSAVFVVPGFFDADDFVVDVFIFWLGLFNCCSRRLLLLLL